MDIELPSKLCSLHVSVASNKGRFQGGKGLEGIGFIPHEIVPFDPKDLAAKRDTLILRAEALLGSFGKDGFPKTPCATTRRTTAGPRRSEPCGVGAVGVGYSSRVLCCRAQSLGYCPPP